MKQHQIPRRIFKPEQQDLGEHARAVQNIFNKIPVVEHRTVEDIYQEPMPLQAAEEPFSVELVRIVNLFAPEIAVTACNGMVHYTWKPQQGGCVITNIGGLSVATNGTTRFRFYYRITFKMVS